MPPRHWIEYAPDWRWTPMAYWVHVEQDAGPWKDAQRYLPEAPAAIPHQGFAILCVEFESVVLRFSSRAQVEECIRVLSLDPLPTSRRLSALRDAAAGPNSHWLSRLPASVKSPRARPKVVKALAEALSATAFPQ